MSDPGIITFNCDTATPSVDFPHPTRCISGNPMRTTWEHFINCSGEMSCGIWGCEIGSWRIQFADNKDEFFCVIEGVVRLHDEKGRVIEIKPGEAAVIPAGFRGKFEVVEPVRKYYVVLERKLSL